MKYKDLSIGDKRKLLLALLKDKDKEQIFNFDPKHLSDIKSLFKWKDAPIDQKIKDAQGLLAIIQAYYNPIVLKVKSNQELKREVDIWYNIMYLRKDEKGNTFESRKETEHARSKLKKRVGHISDWDVSKVTDMSYLFKDKKLFNDDISKWNVSNVTSMEYMFKNAERFNQPLDIWDVSKVTNMKGMFNNTYFNQPLDKWNVSKVTTMENMFCDASHFNQPLNNWERKQGVDGATSTSTLGNVTDMSSMFAGATWFNQSLSKWDVSSVKDMSEMFHETKSFDEPLNWKYFLYVEEFNETCKEGDELELPDMTNMFLGSFEEELEFDIKMVFYEEEDCWVRQDYIQYYT